MQEIMTSVQNVFCGKDKYAILLGDAAETMRLIPDESIDCIITSPPYWQQRDYDVSDAHRQYLIGQEESLPEYVEQLSKVFREVHRILKTTGSLWLNLGDKYVNKNLMGVPWRIAFALQDDGWILRNDVIWEKMKGTQPVKDRLRSNYEHFFHFVKQRKYYYDTDAIRIKPRLQPQIKGQKVVSATGVSGKKYRQQIEKTDCLNALEKQAAIKALDDVLDEIRAGRVVDFRMTIRGHQRTLHGNRKSHSGRARELEEKGFFIMKSHAKGFVPSDVWNLVPEDKVKNRSKKHYAVFPTELLRIPILASCPEDGVILDPFSGVGSTIIAALKHERHCIGIDISSSYIETAHERVKEYIGTLFYGL